MPGPGPGTFFYSSFSYQHGYGARPVYKANSSIYSYTRWQINDRVSFVETDRISDGFEAAANEKTSRVFPIARQAGKWRTCAHFDTNSQNKDCLDTFLIFIILESSEIVPEVVFP